MLEEANVSSYRLNLSKLIQENALYNEVDIIAAKKQIEVYQNLESTKECAEMHYYNFKDLSAFKARVSCSRFWVNYADHLVQIYTSNNFNKPFLSP